LILLRLQKISFCLLSSTISPVLTKSFSYSLRSKCAGL
jgi:hypothetical protein